MFKDPTIHWSNTTTPTFSPLNIFSYTQSLTGYSREALYFECLCIPYLGFLKFLILLFSSFYQQIYEIGKCHENPLPFTWFRLLMLAHWHLQRLVLVTMAVKTLLKCPFFCKITTLPLLIMMLDSCANIMALQWS